MIVAVPGAKGGVGKSTVALNLAGELGAVLVDGDLATPDLPRGDGPTIHDVLAGSKAPDEAVRERNGVRLLPAGRTLAGARAADLTAMAETVRDLHRQYEHVVVDCPPGLARDVGVQVQSADLAVLVTTADEPALQNATRLREFALDAATPLGCVVLNRVSADATDEAVSEAERRLQTATRPVGERSAVAAAFEDGSPVRETDPDSPAVEQFEAVARLVERSLQRDDGQAGEA